MIRAFALVLLGTVFGATVLHWAEPPQRLPLVHAQLTLCSPERGARSKRNRLPWPEPDYIPRHTEETA